MKKFIVTFLLFIVNYSFFFPDCHAQWLLQPWPVSGGTYSIKFFDNNYGIASLDNPCVIRTTNGGVNWNVLTYVKMYKLEKINDSIMYGYGGPTLQSDRIYRTYNKGLTWDSVAIFGYSFGGISFINKDTGYISGFDGSNIRIWKTTNGGVTLSSIAITIGQGKIFFLKYKINGEYYGWCCSGVSMYKTTNSGVNWFQVGSTGHGIWQLEFINENTGFATWGGSAILKTTNGGLNWIEYTMPNAFGVVLNDIKNFKIIDSNRIFGDYGIRRFPNGVYKGVIWKSTNGGVNWGFQQADTTNPYGCAGIDFTDSLNGWSSFVHTTNGGGPIVTSEIYPISTEIPKGYTLYQNYPNPFNPMTTVSFSVTKKANVSLNIYDISGRGVIKIMENEKLDAGIYKTLLNFGKVNLSSGIYFCRLIIRDNNYMQLFSDTKKMMYIK